MGKIAKRSAKAQENLEIIETALEKTQSALRAAEKADIAAGKVAKGSRKLVKLVLIVSVVGVVALLVKKMTGGGSQPAPSQSYSPPRSAPSSTPAASSAATGAKTTDETSGDDAKVVDLSTGKNGSSAEDAVAEAGAKSDPN
ncbi:MAG: hypothetical protein V9F03_06835 [Microthrixaceae bacterium]